MAIETAPRRRPLNVHEILASFCQNALGRGRQDQRRAFGLTARGAVNPP
jgi:hypothetical protein